jgi:hypothetical protein
MPRHIAGSSALPAAGILAAHRHVYVEVYGALDCLDDVVCIAALCCLMEVLWWCIFNKVVYAEAR